MAQKPKQPFDRSFKQFFFDAAEDPRPRSFPDKGTLFPEATGDILDQDSEFDILPDDAAQAEHERLTEIARNLLPQHDEIMDALFYVTHLDILGLMTAATVEDEFRGRLDDAAVDRLTAAALIVGGENAETIKDFFSTETASLIEEFLDALAAPDAKRRQNKISGFSVDAKRLYLASIAADLEITRRNLAEGNETPPSKSQMDAMAALIAQSAAMRDVDTGILHRIVFTYNKLAENLGLSQTLQQKADGTVFVSKNPHRKQPPPQP